MLPVGWLIGWRWRGIRGSRIQNEVERIWREKKRERERIRLRGDGEGVEGAVENKIERR